MSLRAIAIDDKDYCISAVERLVQKHADKVELLDSCSRVEEAYEKVMELKPDLLFLDVEIHDKTGFDLLEMLGDFKPKVIFTTAFQKYASRAFRVYAVDYLEKPIDPDLFAEAIDRALSLTDNEVESDHQKIKYASDIFRNPELKPKYLAVHDSGRTEFLEMNEIMWLQAQESYCDIHYGRGKRWQESKTLKEMMKTLEPEGFIRTHKSFAVNPKFVESFDQKQSALLLKNGAYLEVSRRRVPEVRELLGI